MQYTSSLSTHHQNVRHNSNKNYAKLFHSNIVNSNKKGLDCEENSIPISSATHITHRICKLNTSNNSESDISTNIQIQLRNKSKKHNNIVGNANKRRRKVQLHYIPVTTATLNTCILLVLACLVVKLEYVIGALSLTSIPSFSTNVNSTNYTRTLLDVINDSDIPLSFFDDNHIGNETSMRPQVIYQNEFAVHIFGGIEKANEIAKKHGFTNMGQVSLLLYTICTSLYIHPFIRPPLFPLFSFNVISYMV